MIDLNEYKFSKLEDIVFNFLLLLVGLIISFLFYKNAVFALVVFFFKGRIRKYVLTAIIEKRRRKYLEEFKDFLFVVSTSIGAGRSMKDAIGESIPSISEIHGENAILLTHLNIVYQRMENGRENDVEVLTDLAISSGLEDVVDFVTIYTICKRTGASLVLALNKAAAVIIEKMTIEKEIKEIIRRKESEGVIIFLMPVIVILFLNLCSPDYIKPLYETVAGRIIMTITIASEIGIYGLVQNITHLDI